MTVGAAPDRLGGSAGSQGLYVSSSHTCPWTSRLQGLLTEDILSREPCPRGVFSETVTDPGTVCAVLGGLPCGPRLPAHCRAPGPSRGTSAETLLPGNAPRRLRLRVGVPIAVSSPQPSGWLTGSAALGVEGPPFLYSSPEKPVLGALMGSPPVSDGGRSWQVGSPGSAWASWAPSRVASVQGQAGRSVRHCLPRAEWWAGRRPLAAQT